MVTPEGGTVAKASILKPPHQVWVHVSPGRWCVPAETRENIAISSTPQHFLPGNFGSFFCVFVQYLLMPKPHIVHFARIPAVHKKCHLRQGDCSGKKPLRMGSLKDHTMLLSCCVCGRRHSQFLPVFQNRSPAQGLSSCHPEAYSATKQVENLNHWL